MHRAYHAWESPALGRRMELLVFGHAGAPMVVFPTSMGRFYDYEDRGMVGALSEHIERGWVQLICVDSVDAESWYCESAHPHGRLQRHTQYENYVLHEVLPFVRSQNSNDFIMAHGCSYGAIHAILFGLRHPTYFRRVLGFAGYYDTKRFLDNLEDDVTYYYNPLSFIAGLQEGPELDALRRLEIIMAIGKEDPAAWTNTKLSQLLWDKGIWHSLRLWDGWAHDWPYWMQMINMYISGAD